MSAFIAKYLTWDGCVLAIRYGGCDQCRHVLPACAHNFRLSHQIYLSIRTTHEIPMSVLQRDEETMNIPENPVFTQDPYKITVRKEIWDLVHEVMKPMTPDQQDLVTRYYEYEESLEEISRTTGRNKHALSQALYAAIKHLRKLLEEKGIGKGDF